VLTELLGNDVSVYDGSPSEWLQDPDRPPSLDWLRPTRCNVGQVPELRER
jgi:hypothetical protein